MAAPDQCRLFHEVSDRAFLILTTDPDTDPLQAARLERAIGVIYLPETERNSHYSHARISDQFDAVIHIDSTRALVPLEHTSTWAEDEHPETFPTSM